MAENAILYDTSLCTACKACQVACKCWNNLPSPIELNANKFTGSYQNPPDLNGDTRIIISFSEHEGGHKGIQWAFGRRACQHCTKAPCASVCPEHAIHVDEETGFVTLDQELCVGCQYCSLACPFDVPHYSWSGAKATCNKCTGCLDRVAQGLDPACVTTCQPGALKYGPRDEMLELAHERLDILHERGFDQACIYGENEMGGLHVVQVLKYGIEAHGQVVDPQVSPIVTLINIMKPITGVIAAVAVVAFAAMFGIASGYKRDRRIYNPETGDTISLDTGKVLKHGDGFDEESVKDHLADAVQGFVDDLNEVADEETASPDAQEEITSSKGDNNDI